MKTIFAAAAIVLVIGAASAQARFGGISLNGVGLSGINFNDLGPNTKPMNGAGAIGSSALISIELPR